MSGRDRNHASSRHSVNVAGALLLPNSRRGTGFAEQNYPLPIEGFVTQAGASRTAMQVVFPVDWSSFYASDSFHAFVEGLDETAQNDYANRMKSMRIGKTTGLFPCCQEYGRSWQAVAYARDGDTLIVSTPGTTFKRRSLDRDSRATLCILSNAEPFNFVSVEGRVDVETADLFEGTRKVESSRLAHEPATRAHSSAP